MRVLPVTETELLPLAPSHHAQIRATVLEGSDGKVAYAWRANPDDPERLTIDDLLVLQLCDGSLNPYGQPAWTDEHGRDAITAFTDGWHAHGVGAHDLISVEPLHIEASVYWPSCCGLHGFIRDGRWAPA